MINSMRYVKILEEGGHSKKLADNLMEVWEEMTKDNFATKNDVQFSEFALRSDIKDSESRVRSEMKDMESGIRSDMKDMESGIRSDMKNMEHFLRSDFQELRNEVRSMQDKIVIKLSGIMVIMLSATIAAQKLF